MEGTVEPFREQFTVSFCGGVGKFLDSPSRVMGGSLMPTGSHVKPQCLDDYDRQLLSNTSIFASLLR